MRRSGEILVADYGNHAIRSITPAGDVTTLAGTGAPGHQDGPVATASFFFPQDVAESPATGEVIIADFANDVIRGLSPAGFVRTIAGIAGQSGFTDGLLGEATFHEPRAVACDSEGNVYVADRSNHALRFIQMESGLSRAPVLGAKGELSETITLNPETITLAGMGLPVTLQPDGEGGGCADRDCMAEGCCRAPMLRKLDSKRAREDEEAGGGYGGEGADAAAGAGQGGEGVVAGSAKRGKVNKSQSQFGVLADVDETWG